MNRRLKKETFVILAIGVFILACTIIFNILNYPSKFNVMSKHDRYSTLFYNSKDKETGESISFNKFTGVRTIAEINANKGSKITLDYNSKIVQGKFNIALLDNNYKIIDMLQENKKGSKEIEIKESGRYLIRIVGKKAKGDVETNIASENNIRIIHGNFWD